MSLVRTALRLVVIEALKDATIAGKRIFDSRMDDLSPDLFKGDELPTAIVLSDKDEGTALSEQNGGPPFGRSMELSIEIGMTQRVRTVLEEGADPEDVILYPNTDARLEAALDTFEFQVMRRLQYADDPLCVMFRRFWRIPKYDCHRQVFDETGTKVACRLLTLTCYGGDDQVKTYNTGQDTLPTGYNVLPDPLKSVCELMPVGSSGKGICDITSAALIALTLPPLDGVDIQVDGSLEDEGGADMVDVSIEIQSALTVAETVTTGGAVVIDYQKGTFQRLILAGNVASMSIIGWPRSGVTGRLILQVTNTGNFTISGWPPTTFWSGGSAPSMSLGAGKRDIFVFTAADGGVEFFGNVVGQNYF
jgi:hypothetical protein